MHTGVLIYMITARSYAYRCTRMGKGVIFTQMNIKKILRHINVSLFKNIL